MKRTFTRDYLENLGLPFDNDDIIEHRELESQGRWTQTYSLVFWDEVTAFYWMIHYYVGATENQEIDPFNDQLLIEGTQVHEEEVVTTRWVPYD